MGQTSTVPHENGKQRHQILLSCNVHSKNAPCYELQGILGSLAPLWTCRTMELVHQIRFTKNRDLSSQFHPSFCIVELHAFCRARNCTLSSPPAARPSLTMYSMSPIHNTGPVSSYSLHLSCILTHLAASLLSSSLSVLPHVVRLRYHPTL
jgi:hypothetical protein